MYKVIRYFSNIPWVGWLPVQYSSHIKDRQLSKKKKEVLYGIQSFVLRIHRMKKRSTLNRLIACNLCQQVIAFPKVFSPTSFSGSSNNTCLMGGRYYNRMFNFVANHNMMTRDSVCYFHKYLCSRHHRCLSFQTLFIKYKNHYRARTQIGPLDHKFKHCCGR